MKRLSSMALMLILAIASAYAQQTTVQMIFSGTAGASPIDLKQPNTNTSEEDVAGYGTLGLFTFRNVRAIPTIPQPSSNCSGVFFPATAGAGAGLLRFQDGSLLKLTLMQGGDCIDVVHLVAHCILIFQISGGTGRFQNASGVVTYNETGQPLLSDVSNTPAFFSETGTITGTISGVAAAEDSPDVRQ